MFFDIKIIVAGTVLLTAPGMYDGVVDPKAPFESAVAVAAKAAKTGSYDIVIPQHQAVLVVSDLQHDTTPPTMGASIVLDHQRVFFGKMQSSLCTKVVSGVELSPSTINIPRLNLVMKNPPKLAANARPTGTDFSGMAGGPVAAWLDLPAGKLRATHSSLIEEAVEFRPSERLAVLPSQVFLTVKSGDINCMVVIPFGGNPTTYTFPDPDFTVTFQNTMVDNTGEVVPGIGYDFELLYDLLDNTKDKIPPIPYSAVAKKASQGNGEINTQTGVNCGPPGH
jgi:hypothetical protein